MNYLLAMVGAYHFLNLFVFGTHQCSCHIYAHIIGYGDKTSVEEPVKRCAKAKTIPWVGTQRFSNAPRNDMAGYKTFPYRKSGYTAS